MTTSRTSFNTTWLAEMPDRVGNVGDAFNVLRRNIEEWIQHGHQIEKVSNNLFKLEGNNIVYFWYQLSDDIVIAVELDKRTQGYAVNLVGKNPNYRNSPPYATDLYQEILEHIPYSLLFSDSQLSDDGIDLWKKLVHDPDTVLSVYNVKNPGHSFEELTDPSDLDDYIGTEHRDDRFVLAKRKKSIAETRSYFNIRRLRELSGLGLED